MADDDQRTSRPHEARGDGDGDESRRPCRGTGGEVDADDGEVADDGQGGDGQRGGQRPVRAGFGQPADQAAGGGQRAGGGRDAGGDDGQDGDGGQQREQAGAPGVRVQQEQPPDADQRAGGDEPGEGVPGVAGALFGGQPGGR
nr:hypothetical protein [uncultured Actinoplanes sp.]